MIKYRLLLPEGAVTDAAGHQSLAAYPYTRDVAIWDPPTHTHQFVDRPEVSILAPAYQTGPFDARITFTESVSGFVQSDIGLSGTATASITSFTTTDNIVWTATITPTTSGLVTINIPANVATDAENNGNTAAEAQSVTIAHLSVTISGIYEVDIEADKDTTFDVDVNFSQPVTDFEEADVTLDGTASATVSSIALSSRDTDNTRYDVHIIATTTGTVDISLQANVVTTANGISNQASHVYTVKIFDKHDIDKDGDVDIDDVDSVARAIGLYRIPGLRRNDVDGDRDIDIDDVLAVISVVQSSGASPSQADLFAVFPADILENLDPIHLGQRLDALRLETDRSLTSKQMIAFLEQLLVSMRPEKTNLLANYPNPFNPETWIPYELAEVSDVKITIYNARGSVVRRLELGSQPAGFYTDRSRAAYWNGRNLVGEKVSSGIYFYQLQTDNVSLLRKMVILK